jgi:hypothetical protein
MMAGLEARVVGDGKLAGSKPHRNTSHSGIEWTEIHRKIMKRERKKKKKKKKRETEKENEKLFSSFEN